MRNTLIPAVLLMAAHAHADTAALLIYERSEAGTENYQSRVIVTPAHLRMDMGQDDGNYILYDRRGQVIYSVVHEDKTIASIDLRPVQIEPPVALNLREQAVALGKDAPKVAGRTPVQRQMYAGEQLCQEVVAVPGLLDDAVKARREMEQVLAAEQAAVLRGVPADLHDPCDLAVHTFNAHWVTSFGLPIQERDFTGNSQVLVDYRERFEAAPALFGLPEGYRRYSISDLK